MKIKKNGYATQYVVSVRKTPENLPTNQPYVFSYSYNKSDAKNFTQEELAKLQTFLNENKIYEVIND